jgi:hypothetical protein
MQIEIHALHCNDTLLLVLFHLSINIVGSWWVYKIKHLDNDNVEGYKAHLVAKWFF